MASVTATVAYEGKDHEVTFRSLDSPLEDVFSQISGFQTKDASNFVMLRADTLNGSSRELNRLGVVRELFEADAKVDGASAKELRRLLADGGIKISLQKREFSEGLFKHLAEGEQGPAVDFVYQRLDALNTRLRALNDSSSSFDELCLPSIIVIGDQSVGKSSLICALTGMDILPRSAGTCTRSPLEITVRPKNQFDPQEYPDSFAQFEATGAVKASDLTRDLRGICKTDAVALEKKMFRLSSARPHLLAIRNEIERRTLALAGQQSLTPYPIVLTLVFPGAPSLKIVDLPGIAQHPKKGQPQNIHHLTTTLARHYIQKERTIVISIVAAHYEFQGQGSWTLIQQGMKQTKVRSLTSTESDDEDSKQVSERKGGDTEDGYVRSTREHGGKVFVGVLTFMNRMLPGTEEQWVRILSNTTDRSVEPFVPGGWIAVVTRDKNDVEAFESGDSSRDARYGAGMESKFFANSTHFANVSQDHLGRGALIRKLCAVQRRYIREQLPHILESIQRLLSEHKAVLEEARGDWGSGQDGVWRPPTTSWEKETVCRGLVRRCAARIHDHFHRGAGGYRLRLKFREFVERLQIDQKVYTNDDIMQRRQRMGWRVSTGGLDTETFREMISDVVERRLEKLCLSLCETVYKALLDDVMKILKSSLADKGYVQLFKHVAFCVLDLPTAGNSDSEHNGSEHDPYAQMRTTRKSLSDLRSTTNALIRDACGCEKMYVFDPTQMILTHGGDKERQLNSYIRMVKENLAASIPKLIMYAMTFPFLKAIESGCALALHPHSAPEGKSDELRCVNEHYITANPVGTVGPYGWFISAMSHQGGEGARRIASAWEQYQVLFDAWKDLQEWGSAS